MSSITYRVGLFQFDLDEQFQLFQLKFICSAVVIEDYKITPIQI